MKKLFFLLFISVPHAWSAPINELALYFINSPYGIDWRSPSTLVSSALKNKMSFKSHFMGHVWVELTCEKEHQLTGMTDKSADFLNQLLFEQRGLGILFHSFDGRLEVKEEILKEREELFEEGRIHFVKFKLNKYQCQRTVKYLNEYRKMNIGRYYGLANRPRHGEGAGCSAFGASFVDVLNILDQDMKESWSQTIKIPYELAGLPLSDNKVSLLKLIRFSGSWAKESEKYHMITFWDPDLMVKWVKKKITMNSADFSVLKIKNSKGVMIDKSHFPVPEEPIWLQRLDPKNPKKTALVGPQS